MEDLMRRGIEVIADDISHIAADRDSEYMAINAAEVRGKIRLMYQLELIDLSKKANLESALRSAQMYGEKPRPRF